MSEADRAAEKQASRDEDAWRLASGEISRSDLRRENSYLRDLAHEPIQWDKNERHLEPQAVAALLKQLSPAADELVLIGGQALNLWTERYDGAPELQQKLPFTSKDVDFYGNVKHLERCARLLDVFGAVVFDSSLGDSFSSIRYPQMRDRIAGLRAT